MVLPPHHDQSPRSEEPLTENVFVLSGNSLNFGGWRVTDLGTGEDVAIRVEMETREVIAPQWEEKGPPYPPGSVQYRNTVRVAFSPAEPGNEYRLDAPGGEVVRRYVGPAVPRDPEMVAPEPAQPG